MPRAARGRATRSTRSPATFTLDGHLIETYNHIDDLPHLSSLPKKRPRHATRGATAAERRADRQAAAATDPQPNGIVTRSSRQNLLRPSNSTSPSTAASPSSEPPEPEHPPISCRVCLRSSTATKIICCSICRKGIHTFCLNPPAMDLPNDASWKCIKCRKAHIPLKKEARIILRDALNTYPNLCTDNYVNAVANVVCVVSDSESGGHKKNGKTSIKANGHLEPSHGRANDNTVILRVSTDDSDLDSDVGDDIRPNPIVNQGNPRPARPLERSDSNNRSVRDPDTTPCPQPSTPFRKKPTKQEPLPSSPSSLDIDDERPLSQLMFRGTPRRQRHIRSLKSRDIDPAHASPKLRLKAKQRLMREENPDRVSPSPSDPKPPRDPRNVPPKRRGRKSASGRTENDAQDNAKPMDGGSAKESSGQKRTETKVGGGDQTGDSKPSPAAAPNRKEIKRESNEEEVTDTRATGSIEENGKAKDANPDLSDASASNFDERYPGDTEDDLPLSKRSARYRKLPVPASSKGIKDNSAPEQSGEHESRENPAGDKSQVPCEGHRLQEPKREAFVQETTGDIDDQPVKCSAQSLSAGEDRNPSASNQAHGTNPAPEAKSPGKWAQVGLDPKREALFALARGQRQRPKPGDSSGRLATSLDGESSGRFSKLMSRTKNVPESERQRIQVTALAASNMRRNISNMANTMAVLRPHSPTRVSKGSINLLLQQNQPEVRGDMAPQRSYSELPVQDVTASGHESHRDRESAPPNSSRLHPEGDGGKFPAGMFPSANPRRQEGTGSSSVRPYGISTASGGDAYSMQQQQTAARSGMLSSIEPEAQPYGKHSRDSDLLPHAKRQRNNKSDLRNMLSNDNMVSTDENRNMQRGDPSARVYPEADRLILQQSAARHGTIHGHQSSRPDPYSFRHPLPHNRFETSRAPAKVQGSGSTGQERLSLPQDSVRSMDDRTFSRQLPGSLPYPGVPALQGELRRHITREDDCLIDRGPQGRASTHRGHGSDFRAASQSQVYSSSNPAGESLSGGVRWRDTRNLGAAAVRSDYSTPNTAGHQWPASGTDHRSALQQGSYEIPVNRPIPIDRRTRRPMPYVPTATRKAQFEQGRALAFIDSRPMAPGADPTEVYRVDDATSRIAPRTYSARQEVSYSTPNEYAYPAGGRSRTTYPNLDSQAPATFFRGGYNPHRRDCVGGSGEPRVEQHDTFLADSHRNNVQRERVGSEVNVGGGHMFGQSRPGMHHPGQNASGAPLEPPIDTQKGLAMERTGAPPLGPLVDARTRSHQERDILRMTNALESDRRLADKRTRLAPGPGQEEMGYSTSRMENSTRRGQEFADRSYGSYHSGRNRNEAMRPPVGSIMDARNSLPVHADVGHYRSRDATAGQGRRSFSGSAGTFGSRDLFERPSNQMNNSNGYARSDAEARRSVDGQRVTRLEGRSDDFGADPVSNIPLVARFDNSLTGYIEGNAGARSSDGGSRVGERERSISQQNEQREQLPSLRSKPSLRDLLS